MLKGGVNSGRKSSPLSSFHNRTSLSTLPSALPPLPDCRPSLLLGAGEQGCEDDVPGREEAEEAMAAEDGLCWSPSSSLNMAATKDRLLSPIHLLTGLPWTDEVDKGSTGGTSTATEVTLDKQKAGATFLSPRIEGSLQSLSA